MTTLESLKQELEPYKDTLVIDELWTVAKLIDVIDGDDDYYWVLISPKRGKYHATCVGKWIPLKGKIDDEDYERLERIWKLNEPFWNS
jgi:hypothetical protein